MVITTLVIIAIIAVVLAAIAVSVWSIHTFGLIGDWLLGVSSVAFRVAGYIVLALLSCLEKY